MFRDKWGRCFLFSGGGWFNCLCLRVVGCIVFYSSCFKLVSVGWATAILMIVVLLRSW